MGNSCYKDQIKAWIKSKKKSFDNHFNMCKTAN